MQQAGIVGIIVFIIISMLIIFNTIRMTIFNRRDELVIMRLFGASPGYIRGPFIVETMLYGAVAAAISLLYAVHCIRYRFTNFGSKQPWSTGYWLFQRLFFKSLMVNIDCANGGWYHDRSRLFCHCYQAVFETQVITNKL
jgi:cell division protein FtsX